MNLSKVITDKPNLSLKAMGLLAYLVINEPTLTNLKQSEIHRKLRDGVSSVNSAFTELFNEQVILVTKQRMDGRFNVDYRFNPIYL